MNAKRFVSILAVSLVIYFIPDYFFNDAMLYVLGGAIWGSIHMIFNKHISFFFGLLIGFLMLFIVIFLFQKLRNNPLKIFTLIAIATLLYLFDFLLMKLIGYDPETKNRTILGMSLKGDAFLAIRILFKAFILSLIIYYGNNWNVKKIIQ